MDGLTLVGVVGDARVGALVGSGEGDEVAGGGAAAAGDLELVAAGVELGSRVGVGRVQGDDLVADEVVSGLDAGGDGVRDARVAGNHQGGLFLTHVRTFFFFNHSLSPK